MKKERQLGIYYAFLAAVVVYTIAAIFSIGVHQADEHYQILEFALYKMGINHPENLAWEFGSQLRPGFQPLLAFVFLKFLLFIGISDPFIQMTIIRLIMGLFSIVAIFAGIRAFLPFINNEHLRLPFIFLSPLLWFMPYIAVRFSSETLSGSLFFLSVALMILKLNKGSFLFLKKIPWWLIGLISGLSVISRYSTLLLVFGLLLWLLIIRKEKILNLALITVGLIGGLLAGLFADRWLYGIWCFPLWNSLSMLWTLQGPDFGQQPWWFWFEEILLKGGFFIGFCLMFCTVYFWIRAFKNPITWVMIPFIIFHFIVPHKELRFLFPITFFMPFVILFVAQDLLIIMRDHLSGVVRKISYMTVATLFLLTNIILCCFVIFKPGDHEAGAIKYINRHYNQDEIILLYNEFGNPYDPYGAAPVVKNFYNPQGIEMHRVNDIFEVETYLSEKDKIVLLCLRKNTHDFDLINASGFTPVFKSLQDPFFDISQEYWDKRGEAIELYQYNLCRTIY